MDPLTIQPQEPIKSSIRSKASAYGELTLPYIVAVNALNEYAGADSVLDALFGTPGVVVRQTPSGLEHENSRLQDGVWGTAQNPIHTRVSAVLSTERLTPWSLAQRRARLISNPWAQRPLDISVFGVDYSSLDGERLRILPARALHEIFDVPASWPEY